ncbi:MAG TPA: cell division protein FtsA [Candidatus Krumholzibacteria bacterium]|nr:cell division protein FtsA [Candidatus Krumholzibacteria bacterium]
MDQEPVLAGLDLGSTRFRAVVAEPDGNGGVAILGHASVPSRGFTRSELVDLPAAALALRGLLDTACDIAGVIPQSIAVGVGGSHLRSVSSSGSISLDESGGHVRGEHLERVRRRVQAMGIPFDRVILHCLPVEYTLDGRGGLQNPVGMMGSRLQLDAHLITGEQAAVQAIDRVVEMAGYRADPLVFNPCATATYLISQEEREQGCLLIDIGGELTHFALYCRGRLRQSGVVPLGGNHVTRDIAYVLGVDPKEAEVLKRTSASALRSKVLPHGGTPTASTVDSPSAIRTRVAAVCEPRQQEILEHVASGLQWGVTRPALAAGIVLTGGGSRIPGTVELAEQVFALRADQRRAPGDDLSQEPDSWATALGLSRRALQHEHSLPLAPISSPGGGRLWSNFKRILDRIV